MFGVFIDAKYPEKKRGEEEKTEARLPDPLGPEKKGEGFV